MSVLCLNGSRSLTLSSRRSHCHIFSMMFNMSCWGDDQPIVRSRKGGYVDFHTIHARGSMRSAAAAAARLRFSRNCSTGGRRYGRDRGICFSCGSFQYWILGRRSSTSTVAHSSSIRNRSRLLRYHIDHLCSRNLNLFVFAISVTVLAVWRSIRWLTLCTFCALWRLFWCRRRWRRRHPPEWARNVID